MEPLTLHFQPYFPLTLPCSCQSHTKLAFFQAVLLTKLPPHTQMVPLARTFLLAKWES